MAAAFINRPDLKRKNPMLRNAGAAGLVLWLGLTLTMLCLDAQAQSHEQRQGDYVLRSSVVTSTMLPEKTARQHGIEPAEDRAVLNVVLLGASGDRLVNLPARVTATALDLNGRPRSIELKATVANNMVSYIGSFEFLPREVLDFRIVAVPASGGPTITLEYRDRMRPY